MGIAIDDSGSDDDDEDGGDTSGGSAHGAARRLAPHSSHHEEIGVELGLFGRFMLARQKKKLPPAISFHCMDGGGGRHSAGAAKRIVARHDARALPLAHAHTHTQHTHTHAHTHTHHTHHTHTRTPMSSPLTCTCLRLHLRPLQAASTVATTTLRTSRTACRRSCCSA
eukprot:366293-Chlamydomonas_euryale.AAC.6